MSPEKREGAFRLHTAFTQSFARSPNFDSFSAGINVGIAHMKADNETLKLQLMHSKYYDSANRIAQLEAINAALIIAIKQISG
jgi:hypothetical protein